MTEKAKVLKLLENVQNALVKNQSGQTNEWLSEPSQT